MCIRISKTAPGREAVYVSFAQNPQPFAMLAIRTEGDPLRFTSAVREQVRALDRDQAHFRSPNHG